MPGKLLFCFGLLVFVLKTASAQEHAAEYYPFEPVAETFDPRVATDSTLFYRAVQSGGDLFGNSVRYRFAFTRYARRGRSDAWHTAIGTLPVAGDYAPVLRTLGLEETFSGGLWRGGQPESFFLLPDEPYRTARASVRFSDRGYTAGVRGGVARLLSRKWEFALGLDARTGRDLHAEGVFSQAAQAGIRLTGRFPDEQQLTLVAVVPLSMRGLRAAITREAAGLTGDPLYNPLWGYQDGKVRNSRVRREVRPLVAILYRRPLGASTELSLGATAEAGLRRTSGLGWYDARSRMPDNYRYMPGYAADPDRRAELEAVWRSGDWHYTQIDWDELYRENALQGGHSAYFVADRAERLLRMQFSAEGRTDPGGRFVVRYGVEAGYERMRRYREMRDLLGGEYIIDRDQYLLDDDAYGTLLQNDLRRPDRVIREGGRFGYDYAAATSRLRVWAEGEYRADQFSAGVRVALGSDAVRRRGYYEKELFPGNGSFGRSRRIGFAPYAIAARAGWAFTPRCYLEAVVRAASEAPAFDALFLNPEYNNRPTDRPATQKSYGAELNLTWQGRSVELRGSAFASLMTDGVSVVRYFDDAASRFCDRVAEGIGLRMLGIEVAAAIRLSYRWRLSLAASAGSYRHVRNPRVTVFDDRDNTLVDDRSESHMGGCRIGGAPGFTAFAGIDYFGPKGWGLKCSAAIAGRRYVEPEPLRRTLRIAGQLATSPETFAAFTRQERLPAALSVDATLFKTFYFDRSRLTLVCSATNLLGDRDRLYAGYESIRTVSRRSGDATVHMPLDSRYLAAYPRTFFLSVSYVF